MSDGGDGPRPPPNPTPGPSQATDPLNPKLDDLQLLNFEVTANAVASRETVTAILNDLKAKSQAANSSDLVSLAWACYHNGASRLASLSSVSPCGVSHAAMKDIAEVHGTLRQLCMFYAKVIYDLARRRNIPPANWSAKGFTEETRFAAFDFFNGVLSPAAIEPEGGMKYRPTPAEQKAHATNAKMAIAESQAPGNQFSTRGNILGMQQVRSAPPPPMITFD